MTRSPPQKPIAIAIVGVGALFPGSHDAEGYLADLLAGRDRIGPVPRTHWLAEDHYDPDPSAPDKIYVQRGGFIEPIDFDPLEWGIPPSVLPATDTTQLLALLVAKEVLADVERSGRFAPNKERTSVILGATSAQKLLGEMNSRLQRPVWAQAMRAAGLDEARVAEICERIAASYVPWQESTFPGVLGNVVAGRIANRFDLGGTNCVLDAACASSLSALAMSIDELTLGHSDAVICGGADTMNDPFMFTCFAKTTALSRRGDCRPFDASADGTMLGEGVGLLALMRLEDAEASGQPIYAVLRGLGRSSDGRAKSIYAPRPEGQARALRRAYAQAGYAPSTVELLEAHGTGTAAGDAAELAALREVFEEGLEVTEPYCAIGSVKSQVGHTKAAAGAAGLIKATLALRHGVLPPTAKVERPSPALGGPFYVSQYARPWIRDAAHPRRASVSAFGFGGSNFHVTLEAYEGLSPKALRLPTDEAQLFTISAESPAALAEAASALSAELEPPASLRFEARESQRRFRADAPARLAFVARDAEETRALLERARAHLAAGAEGRPPLGVAIGLDAPLPASSLAFLFPGQGSQRLEMGAALAMRFEPARAVWDRAQATPLRGGKLASIVFPPPRFDAEAKARGEAALRATEHAQPALAACEAAALAVLERLELRPGATAGHSFGELSALYAAGAFDEATLFALARERGEAMAEAATSDGAMCAVNASREWVSDWLEASGLPLSIANDNHPSQVVLSGATEAIEEAERRLKDAGRRASRLPVATAFHSPIVADAAERFGRALASHEIVSPRLAVFANTTAAPHAADPAAIRETLAAQLASPVRFVEEIEAMYEAGARFFLEVGPGGVLCGLTKRILGDRPHRVAAIDRAGEDGVTALLHALRELSAAGVPLRFEALWEGVREPRDPRLEEKPRMSVSISGANIAKPYPPAEASSPAPAAKAPSPKPPSPAPRPSSPAAPLSTTPASASTSSGTTSSGTMSSSPKSPPRFARSGTATRVAPRTATPEAPVEPAPPRAPLDASWAAAFVEAQRETARAHAAYQESMAEAHTAFLRASERTLDAILRSSGAAAEGTTDRKSDPGFGEAEIRTTRNEVPGRGTGAWPEVVEREPRPDVRPASAPIAPGEARGANPSEPTSPVRGASPRESAPSIAPARASIEGALLAVVAEKTGYPPDMLTLEMSLEADLGVDSIKRVEILAALKAKLPDLPDLDPAKLGTLATLGEILTTLEPHLADPGSPSPASGGGSGWGPPAESIPYRPDSGTSAGGSANRASIEAALLAVVAEKTGYPPDMLNLEMSLEADLGVDSIKRVEILAALKTKVPNLPDLDPAKLGTLSTLGEILTTLEPHLADPGSPAPARGAGSGGGPPAESIPYRPDAGTPAEGGLPRASVEAALLQVVAEKTGYPPDMLTLEMSLEADLGVDSIKRVEILAALKAKVPDLPDLDPAKLGTLATLGEILDTLGAASLPSTSVPAPEPVRAAARPSPIGRYTSALEPRPAPELAPAALLEARRGVILGGEGTLARSLADHLRARGARFEIADALPDDADALILLHGLDAESGPRAAHAALREAFDLARRFAPRAAEGGLFVTVQDTGASFGLEPTERARLAGLVGLTRTAALEWPKVTARAIDIDTRGGEPAAIAARIASELCEGGLDLEVALGAERRVLTLEPAPARERQSDGHGAPPVVVASGGARGVTAACLEALARSRPGARFLLLGRTPLAPEPDDLRGLEGAALLGALAERARRAGVAPVPRELAAEASRVEASREVRATLAALEAAGAEARYAVVDVTDATRLGAALDEARAAFGPFTTLVHAAGVLADRRLEDKTLEDFDRVVGVKLGGLDALLDATRSDELETILLFSSVAGRFGNPGQSDYAIANASLDALATLEASRRPNASVRALAWGPWRGGMVTPALAAHFEARGVPLIDLAEGAACFVEEHGAVGSAALVVGAGPIIGRVDARARFAVEVSARTHPELLDHAVDGVPVLPVASVLELFARAARVVAPELTFARCRQLEVLRGVRLSSFDEGAQLTLVLERLSNGHGATHRATLESAVGLHYRAEIDLTPEPLRGDAPRPIPAGLEPLPGPIYGGCLFHGERFQVIAELGGLGEAGAHARVEGSTRDGWAERPWALDPALLDGGFQLVVLWAERRLGGDTLPTGLGELCVYRAGPIDEVAEVRVYGRSAESGRAVADVTFLDAEGRWIAELRGVEVHIRPSRAAAASARSR